VRADESKRRAALLETEFKKEVNGAELWIYRPLLQWTAQDCFDMHKKHGIEPNPLYKMGMSRVGCMPCMQCRQSELIEISRRFPKEVKRIKRWEQRVAKASRRGGATFFPAKSIDSNTTKYPTIDIVISNIENKKPETCQYEIFSSLCSSVYGLCE
jgi:3'-phosphoadenosine 5'-phosphosulfate sulfotransferase (PAPS reductase)/FAD synthetase